MMNNILRLLVLFAVLAFTGTICNAATTNKDWLIGDWILTYDPDNSPKDLLTFSDSGKFKTTEVSSGREIFGHYLVVGQNIKIDLVHKGKIIMKINLEANEEKDKLYYKSNDSKNVSYYTKTN